MRIDITGAANQGDAGRIIEEQTDGKIFVSAVTWLPALADTSLAACRLNADGTLDETFGNAGKRSYENAAISFANPTSLILEPDGKYIITGYSASDSNSITFLFLDADGSPNPAYGATGYSNFPGLGAIARVNKLADGKFIGMGKLNNVTESPFAAFRFVPEPNLGLSQDIVAQIVVYPNPVVSSLTVKTNRIADARIAVYDLSGRQLTLPSSVSKDEIRIGGFENLQRKLSSETGKQLGKPIVEDCSLR